jgi:hypothetical protein
MALGGISGELERALISDLGVPIDYFQIRAAETVGGSWSNVQIAIGRQIGDDVFVTVAPRLCDDFSAIAQALQSFYPSLEYRMTRSWKLSLSVDPAQPCGVLTSGAGSFRPQLGADIVWDRRY